MRVMERFGGKFVAWTIALALSLGLLGLLVATGESIRHVETATPSAEPIDPEMPFHYEPIDKTYHHPALAAWMTP